MKEARLTLTEGMQRILGYPRFAGPPRILILDTDYFFDRSWHRAAEKLGWQTAGVRSVMTGALTREDIAQLFTAVGEFKPDFVLASNYAGMDTEGMFSRFFEDARIPYVSWFTDTPRMILYDRHVYASHYSVAATWEKAYIPHFERLGFHHVLHMPHATDPALFHGVPAARFDRELAFVGSSMTEQAAEAWEKLEEMPVVAKAVREAFDQGRVTRERFAEGIESILPLDVLAACDRRTLRHAELCLVYEATRRERAQVVATLNPLDIEVRGDAHWAGLARHVGGGVGYFDHLAGFYRRTAVNINTTSLQMKSAVNQRVFDCPAAGGFLLTDRQADLEDLFDPEGEIATYSTLEELEDKARHYLRHPEERERIVRNAQRRIAAHHTHAHRLQTLVEYLKERYA